MATGSPSAQDPTTPADESIELRLALPPGIGNPRNSEGDLVRLGDGSLLFAWTRFQAGRGGDHDPASIVCSRYVDASVGWSEPRVIVAPTEGMNVMSVTLRALDEGRLALFHLRKRSLVDCRPLVRFSDDEAKTWSAPVEIVADDDVGYDVLNNDRVLVSTRGTILVPVARHAGNDAGADFSAHGRLRCYRSSDGGRTWSAGAWAPMVDGVLLQEPGLFQARDGSLRMFARTDQGVQYSAESNDDGRTWSQPSPWTLRSPLSPASVERLPDGDLLAIWNEPGATEPDPAQAPRTPLVAARSSDEGLTWGPRLVLLDHADGWYCYVAQLVEGERLILASCAGDRRTGNGLESTVLLEAPIPPRSSVGNKHP